MSEPSISVVIPAYRAAKTIGRAIASVIAQTRGVLEILVIDDGSPDDLRDATERFGAVVAVIRKENGGAASARNLGIERARGDWIAFLDADDYWHPDKLRRQCEIMAKYPEVEVIGCRWMEVAPSTIPQENDHQADWSAGVAKLDSNDERHYGNLLKASGTEAFALAMRMWTSSLMIRRAVLATRRFESGFEPAEDRELWVRLAVNCRIYLLRNVLAAYVQEPGSLSRTNADRDCGNMLRVLQRSSDLLGPRTLREQKTRLYQRWAARQLAAGQPRAAIRPALNRIKLQPLSAEGWWIVAKSIVQSALRPSKAGAA